MHGNLAVPGKYVPLVQSTGLLSWKPVLEYTSPAEKTEGGEIQSTIIIWCSEMHIISHTASHDGIGVDMRTATL